MNKKNKIKYLLRNNRNIYSFIRVVYSMLFHRERLLKKKSYGDHNPDRTILVIRPNSEDGIQGLMSLLVQALRWMKYANDHGYLTYVDYLSYKTQYFEKGKNAWDFFFEQPDGLEYSDTYKSNNVILSGVSLKKNIDESLFREYVFKNKKSLETCHNIITKKLRFTDEVNQIIEDENQILNVEECLGVYIRGTDYAKLKPTGEFKQPSIKLVCRKIKEFSKIHSYNKIFLVTEDEEYYKILKSEFGERLCTVSFDSFVSGYDGKKYLSETNLMEKNKKKRGVDYLVKIFLLSKCKYLISSMTMGSIAAYCFNGGKYEDEYIFDLGYYD